MNDDFTPALVPVCGQRARLTDRLVAAALECAPAGSASADDVERDLRCTLQAHATGGHHAFVLDLDGRDTGAVWARWEGSGGSPALTVRPDCPARTPLPPGDACCQYADHPGGHSYELTDPWQVGTADHPRPR